MKKLLALLALASVLLYSCDKEKVIKAEDLPAKSTGYISTHFPARTIVQVVKDRNELNFTYHVYLDNQTLLDFNRDGDIQRIEGTTALPATVLPVIIINYVNTNYPTAEIYSWNPESTNQYVGLSNGLSLEFDTNGNFLRIKG